ncbi:MAG TPA: hypothetical protein PLP42_19095 [Acidobacteriota bacterium]|nr:hypothetical protein [Acidobacteriota bacterium]
MIRAVAAILLVPFVVQCGQAASVSFEWGQVAHIVATPQTALEKRIVDTLSQYLDAVLGEDPKIVGSVKSVPKGRPAVVLAKGRVSGIDNPPELAQGSPEAFALWTDSIGGRAVVVATGSSDRGLKRAIQRMVIMSEQTPSALVIPECRLTKSPWIPEREWAVCPWAPQHVRGAFTNPHADNRMNIWLFSDDQLARYVDMFDWFGFSGAQLMETAYSYSLMSSPAAFQGRQRKLAEFLKRNGQNVSLWVWAAEFNGYGWLDPDVTFTPAPGLSAFDDPDVRRGFEKYYNHYAELAPYVDRLIGHFYDPGHLSDRSDVFKYMRLLEQKFKARNPGIKMSIDAWAAGIDYLEALVDNGFTDYLLLEMSMPHLFKPGERERYHEKAKQLGLQIGIWGWYTTEYETDQLASMYVNAQLLKDFYNRMKNGALQIHPASYWSEMEAHHINNIYTMYAASQLLWDPSRDPHEILAELTNAIWGPRNGPVVLEALELIQDVRSGPRWETYWWTLPEYRLGTANPSQDLKRATKAVASLKAMRRDEQFVPKIPLPYEPEVFVELMLPHLLQIQDFARFRLALDDIRIKANSGTPKQELTRLLEAAWQPIPEYNTWVGTFGQPEARMQEMLVMKLAEELGVSVRPPGWWQEVETQRLLEKIQKMQQRERQAFTFSLDSGGGQKIGEFLWRPAKLKERLNALVTRGVVMKIGEDLYQLTNWEDYRNLR